MAPYEEIADSRPRIRRDVLYTRTPEGVLFHNAHGGFGLTAKDGYRFASLIVPHLNGQHTVAEISQGFGEHHRSMLAELVGTLYSRGFARDAGPAPAGPPLLTAEVAARFGPQVEYIDHYTGGAEERFHRFRETRVAVLGEDELARWSALSLVRNGCAAIGVLPGLTAAPGFAEVEAEVAALAKAGCPVAVATLPADRPGPGWAELDGYDVVLVTGPAATRQVGRLLDAGIPAGRLLLPAWTIGGSAVIGPLMSADRTGCWLCAALRLGASAHPGDAAELWSALATPAPLTPGGRAPRGPLAAMLGNLLGYEVFRLISGALPAETDGRLLVQDLDSLDVIGEPLLPHPHCPRCTAGESVAGTAWADLAVADLAATGSTGDELDRLGEEGVSEAALAELEDRAVLVGPHAGVFAGYADDAWRQTPLKVGTVTLTLAPGRRREISAADVHHVAGARLRALYRAAEVYAEHVVPAERSTGDTELARVRPELLSTASGVPAGAVRAWSPATSLLTGRRTLVPTAALRTFGPDNGDRAFEATSAGTGAGGTPAEAVARGLRTALGHDALRRALRGEMAPRAVPLELLQQDVQLTFLARSAQNHGLELELLRLGGTDEPLPVVLARAADPATGQRRWSLGSGLGLRDALLEAVRDLLGAVQLDRDPALGESAAEVVDPGDPLLGELDPAVLAPAGEDGAGLGEDLDWPQVLDRLRAAGRDVLLAPAGSADLRAGRIEVVKVLLTDGTSDA
ncbi:TOMM precursor leader peptide-binding protein [Streptomyces sp. TLI_171]|uniref:TOMM precursor leader peptide-binding protein n=1 Tax=Streptomyces sp. TLI_171 TaxID=1938859 RepID=UPI000C1A3B67|nr:TOMM precursor leader peptide-binding protein [Streptomyces sp. TLI_171]RKE17545.1 bacteriocin biosynthesis cyclodehydratase domain-containing protein [Streptomyces sp. TLI_171]